MAEALERPMFKRTIDTQAIIDKLMIVDIGEIATYAELTELIGRDIQRVARSNLDSARRILRNEKQMEFGAVKNKGIKRLADSEIVEQGQDDLKRISRHSKRAMRKLSCIQDEEKMSSENRHSMLTLQTLFAMTRTITNNTAFRKVSGKVAQFGKALPFGKTLDQFKE